MQNFISFLRSLMHKDPMSIKTRLFHLWFLFSRPMTLGVRAVVIDDQKRVLLVRHTYVAGWHFPGGGVDAGEACQDAVLRELKEETGLLTSEPAKLFGLYLNRKVTKRDHVAVYTLSNFSGTLKKQAGEIAELGWFAIDDLPAETTQGVRDRLAEIIDGKAISKIW